MFKKVIKSFQYGPHMVVLETGEIARQSNGSVLVSMEDTIVLATVVANREAKANQRFFPLTVDYIEKTYAVGRIPGGFFKREGKPSEKEILTSRLIDRSLRPLFPKNFFNEVHIMLHTLSVNPEINPDIVAMIAASSALAISGIPFESPVGAARVGYIDGKYILNPNSIQIASSELDLVIAGSENAIIMVEAGANQLSEEIILSAMDFGHTALQAVIENIHNLVSESGKLEWDWNPPEKEDILVSSLKSTSYQELKNAYKITDKQIRVSTIHNIKSLAKEKIIKDEVSNGRIPRDDAIFNDCFHAIESEIIRGNILNGEPRIDGRNTRSVRPINIRTQVLPRAHGSALFTRGETQALVVATLGTKQNEQIIDALMGEYRDRFILHYNMPPFATGEIGRIGIPKRREVGHGCLAKRALIPVLPSVDEFQYTIRLVSEITESNGSSSMASVCGGSLAMMDAGIPINDHVAGVAMGLILEDGKFSILTDIQGDEDHLGDMDFKVAGTERGITALQMDIKIQGISQEILHIALIQAREGRFHILQEMKKTLESSRNQLSIFAPSMVTLTIKPEKIRDVIGKGGATIRTLTEETGAQIDISDNGTIIISSVDEKKTIEAKRRINELTADVEVGQIYDGQVLRILDFGAIIQILPGKDGLLHISEIANYRINSVNDILSVGQQVRVKLIEADDKGRLRLSMKVLIDSNQQKDISNDERSQPHKEIKV
ncbi:MAG: polyribonucleotide nucleotidyltransferase [Bordetella sp.]|nr:MAG: polyribonucleotide nucleotidyltransferase [Bordetella sp.]